MAGGSSISVCGKKLHVHDVKLIGPWEISF